MGISSRRVIVGETRQVAAEECSRIAGEAEKVCDANTLVRSARLACSYSRTFPVARMMVAQQELSNEAVIRSEPGSSCQPHREHIIREPFAIGHEAMTTGIPKVKSDRTPTISIAVRRYVLEWFIVKAGFQPANKGNDSRARNRIRFLRGKHKSRVSRILIRKNHPTG
jgi:hypothetical protein